MGSVLTAVFLSFAVSLIAGSVIITVSLGIICGVMIILGATMMKNPHKVYTGSVLVFAFSLISLITGGGFFLVFILGLIGGILGQSWKPPSIMIPPPPPPV